MAKYVPSYSSSSNPGNLSPFQRMRPFEAGVVKTTWMDIVAMLSSLSLSRSIRLSLSCTAVCPSKAMSGRIYGGFVVVVVVVVIVVVVVVVVVVDTVVVVTNGGLAVGLGFGGKEHSSVLTTPSLARFRSLSPKSICSPYLEQVKSKKGTSSQWLLWFSVCPAIHFFVV